MLFLFPSLWSRTGLIPLPSYLHPLFYLAYKNKQWISLPHWYYLYCVMAWISLGPFYQVFLSLELKVMIVLQYSCNNSAYKVSVSASLGAVRCRRQRFAEACVASKQLRCLLCVIWRACCPCSIQGFHTSLTHFSLPGFLLTGHKLSEGREAWDQRKKISQGLISVTFLPHILRYNNVGKSQSFTSNSTKETCDSEGNSPMHRQGSGFVS